MTTTKNFRILCSLLLLSTFAFGMGIGWPAATLGRVFASQADPLLAEAISVTDESVVFLYESRADLPLPEDELAKIASIDYANARDEFTRYDIFQRVKLIVEERLAEARATKLVSLVVRTNIGDYNFETNSFPTGLSEQSYIPFRQNSYAATFTNGADLEFIPVNMATARSLAPALRESRRGTVRIYGEIQAASEQTLRFLPTKALSVRITRIELSLQSGTAVGSKAVLSATAGG